MKVKLTNSYWHYLALMAFAIDKGIMSRPVEDVIKQFNTTAPAVMANYTCKMDKSLYIEELVGSDPIDFFIDYVLCYAQWTVESGSEMFGIYNKDILRYNN